MNRGFDQDFVDITIKNYVNLNVLYENKQFVGMVAM